MLLAAQIRCVAVSKLAHPRQCPSCTLALWSSSHSSAVCAGSLPQQTRVMGLPRGMPAPLEAPLAQPGVPALLAPLLANPLLQNPTMTATGSAACRRCVLPSVTLLLLFVNTLPLSVPLSVPKGRVCACCAFKFTLVGTSCIMSCCSNC